jgi:hypothetical protein
MKEQMVRVGEFAHYEGMLVDCTSTSTYPTILASNQTGRIQTKQVGFKPSR